ncbi:porin [Candidatus Halocynthiibacter alkanivorans]|uniref:porin n=1 Tax=Candidatus Halocynthiibacter alkanivorans TaxID=2267619 RepID=UPI000DF32BDC|nr:porin [Candidatus Halocynthiibacter alkanivorans]
MKNILLSTVALVAFAGAAAADVSWSGAATLGYNDDLEDGVYADVDIDIALSQELNNGWTAAAKFGFELVDNGVSGSNGFQADENILISLTNDMYGLYFGDTEFAAVSYFSGVTNMQNDNFSEEDGEDVLKLTATYGMISGGLSYAYLTDTAAGTGDSDELQQLSLGVSAEFSGVTVTAAWQDATTVDFNASNGDFTNGEVFGLSVSSSFSGADITLAYANDKAADNNSTGIEVSYPMGAVTLGAFYVSETNTDDNFGATVAYSEGDLSVKAWVHDGTDEDYGVNIAYAMGDWGLYVGGSDDDGAYVAGELDLGGGASFTVSYANDEDKSDNDEIGPQEYLQGTTLALSLSF